MTTHVTLLPLDVASDPTDADAVHKLTMALFEDVTLPADGPRAGANILWRLEPDCIRVTSDIPATTLPEGATASTEETVHVRGQKVRFIATVDAIVRVRGRNVPVTDTDAWFKAKVQGTLDDVNIQGFGTTEVRRRGATMEQVTLAGEATVTDPDRLGALLRTGVGRSKTFGCGLMTVVPG